MFLSMEQLPDLMTVEEVAEQLRVSDETVHRWARLGRLPFIPLGGTGPKRFKRQVVNDFAAGVDVATEAASAA